jgi:hypothetical protein
MSSLERLQFHLGGSVMKDLVPSEFYLSQNYPNPFNEQTTIKLCVAYKTKVKLEVFDPQGKMVRTLLDEEKEAGTYEVEFFARGGSPFGEDANALPEGIYVYKLMAGDFSATKQMLLLRQKTSPLASAYSGDDLRYP